MFSILNGQLRLFNPASFVGLGKGEWHTPPASVYWRNPRRTKGRTADQAGSREAESSSSEGSGSLHSSGRYSWWVLSHLLGGYCSWGAGAVTQWKWHLVTLHIWLETRVLESPFYFEFFHMCNMKKTRGFFFSFLMTKIMVKKKNQWQGLLSHTTVEQATTSLYCSSCPQISVHRRHSSFTCK